jgi:hypothetical protein
LGLMLMVIAASVIDGSGALDESCGRNARMRA